MEMVVGGGEEGGGVGGEGGRPEGGEGCVVVGELGEGVGKVKWVVGMGVGTGERGGAWKELLGEL
ncbi:hypothetical protein, partial [Kocuria rosea]|uniref:hypothetical protein n=1 Tax=Kocuria rosea TaxID=1275 RepID=UPI001C92F5B0